MSGTISFPVTEQKYTNTGTKNVPRHVNHCANGQHKCWWWCGKATRAELRAAFLVWELWLAAQPSPTGAEVPRSPVLASAIPTYWSNLSVCQWTFMNSLVHQQHCSRLVMEATESSLMKGARSEGRRYWNLEDLIEYFYYIFLEPSLSPHPPGI